MTLAGFYGTGRHKRDLPFQALQGLGEASWRLRRTQIAGAKPGVGACLPTAWSSARLQPWRVPDLGLLPGGRWHRQRPGQVDVRGASSGGYGGRGRSPFRSPLGMSLI